MDRRTFLLGLGGAALTLALPEAAEAASWRRLATTRVNGLIDVDRVFIGAGAGQFRRIRLRVRGNALLMYRFVVQYGNGVSQEIAIRSLIPRGGYTRAIDLRGGLRNIRSVSFAYGKFPNGGGPTWVDVYGFR